MARLLRSASNIILPVSMGMAGAASAAHCAEGVTVDDALQQSGFIRIPVRERFEPTHHLIYAALDGPRRIPRYETWYNAKERRVRVIARFGETVCGHPGIVHGGATSLCFDDVFGSMFFSLNLGTGFTANLNVDFRAPLPQGKEVLFEARLVKHEGRKVFMEAVMCEASTEAVRFLNERPALQEGETLRIAMRHAGATCYAEAKALFITKAIPSSEAFVRRAAKRQRQLVAEQEAAASQSPAAPAPAAPAPTAPAERSADA